MVAVSSWLHHRGSTSSIVSIVFAINQDDDEQFYVARWPKFFPAPESAARLPEAAVPSNKRAAHSSTNLEARRGQSTKTRRRMAAAGEQPTAATVGRMLLVVDTEDGVGPSKRTWAPAGVVACPMLVNGTPTRRISLSALPESRSCTHCGGSYTGSARRTPCPLCGWSRWR